MGETIKVVVNIPFPSKREAQIAYDVLRIDSEPKRSRVEKRLLLNGNTIETVFIGDIAKNIRVGVTAFFESLILCCETLQEFGPAQSESYSH